MQRAAWLNGVRLPARIAVLVSVEGSRRFSGTLVSRMSPGQTSLGIKTKALPDDVPLDSVPGDGILAVRRFPMTPARR
jgi:hypothetical protein